VKSVTHSRDQAISPNIVLPRMDRDKAWRTLSDFGPSFGIHVWGIRFLLDVATNRGSNNSDFHGWSRQRIFTATSLGLDSTVLRFERRDIGHPDTCVGKWVTGFSRKYLLQT
jgi:hypothetical protein